MSRCTQATYEQLRRHMVTTDVADAAESDDDALPLTHARGHTLYIRVVARLTPFGRQVRALLRRAAEGT